VRRGRGREPDRPPPAQHHRPRVPRRAPGRVRGQGLRRVKPSPFPGDPPITPQLVREHNLTDFEYGLITALLARTPTFAELAVLNSLRFGSLDDARNRYLCAGVVKGVGDYGNCVGVPTLGGEVDFGPSYGGNPLVNAMCVGLLRERDLITAAAQGVGNVLLVVGSRT